MNTKQILNHYTKTAFEERDIKNTTKTPKDRYYKNLHIKDKELLSFGSALYWVNKIA
ncbi:MAG: hypothetical protein L3J43_00955 [Sulfurovum sp.]|nr:hypothetical protein [Sulfurovum sp.]